MVLWEITLATAYCLGLKRTYRIVLRLQRRLLARHPRIRAFVFRRARGVFDVALRAHRAVQQRDIDANKSFGNRLLRFLDRLRPSANIRPHPENEVAASKQLPRSKDNSSSSGRAGGGAGGGTGGGSTVTFAPVSTSLYRSHGFGGFGVFSGDLHAAPRRTLPLILLDNFWTPLKTKLELSQRHRSLSSACFSDHYKRQALNPGGIQRQHQQHQRLSGQKIVLFPSD